MGRQACSLPTVPSLGNGVVGGRTALIVGKGPGAKNTPSTLSLGIFCIMYFLECKIVPEKHIDVDDKD